MPEMRERAFDFGEEWQRSRTGLLLPPEPPKVRRERPVGLGLFAGAGGFDLGMHQAGIHVAAANEFDPWASLTYLVNLGMPGVQIHFLDGEEGEESFTRALRKQWNLPVPKKSDKAPLELTDDDLAKLGDHMLDPERTKMPGFAGTGWIAQQPPEERYGCEHFYFGDVRKLRAEDLLADLGLTPGELDVVCGGPPCQGYSLAGKRDVMDPRNSLVFEFTRLVREIQPKAFVMENVPGMASMVTEDGVPVVDALALDLQGGGYGTLQSIKNMLEASSGVGAAVKAGEKPKRHKQVVAEEEEEAETVEAEEEAQLGFEVGV